MDARPLIVAGLEPQIVASLRQHGHEVEEAGDGWRVIELADRVHPAAVVTAADLTGPDTEELLRRIKRVHEDCRAVVLLEEPGSHEAAQLLRAGADGVLSADADVGYIRWALHEVARGGVALSPAIARELVSTLTESVLREREWARALAERAQQAEALARAKADFVGNVSHELRTPLTVLKGVSSTLARNPANEVQARLLAEAEAAADKLTAMVDEILTQAEVQRGKFVLDFQPCDVAQVVREGSEETAAKHPDVAVQVIAPERMPAVADARAIRGVTRQLVDNACRYSPQGGAVTVKARASDEGITVHVTDRGPGFRRGQMVAAFGEAFSPGEEILTKQHAGLGLGLNLARSLLALHGGILWAEPLPGGGSRVSFTIPAEGPVTPAAAEEQEPDGAILAPASDQAEPERPATASTSS